MPASFDFVWMTTDPVGAVDAYLAQLPTEFGEMTTEDVATVIKVVGALRTMIVDEAGAAQETAEKMGDEDRVADLAPNEQEALYSALLKADEASIASDVLNKWMVDNTSNCSERRAPNHPADEWPESQLMDWMEHAHGAAARLQQMAAVDPRTYRIADKAHVCHALAVTNNPDEPEERESGVELIIRCGAGMRGVEMLAQPNSIRLRPDEAVELARVLMEVADEAREMERIEA